MRIKAISAIKYGIMAIVMTLAISQATVSAQESPERTLEGVWEVFVTPRNCATGEPIPAAAFESLQTFHQGGTMSMSIRNNTNVAAVVRTPFHGLWRKGHGWSEYAFKVVHIRSNAATGAFAGKQESGGNLVLSASGDEFTTDGYTIVYSVDGVPGPPNCSNSVGTRFKLN